ncbi:MULTISPECIES: hypothetical protein [Nitrosomonas]|uniref:hypothetical protein n=1 Tax=Nitrosomonas TaxID=914 RepID=UPI0013050A6E|nr:MULTISPECIES: hypothetical protein [Nitrosomonas]QOJ09766.1 MAG: hypothetical protein HRU73_10105 [Nitrosomonas sp. H1_AOB3]
MLKLSIALHLTDILSEYSVFISRVLPVLLMIVPVILSPFLSNISSALAASAKETRSVNSKTDNFFSIMFSLIFMGYESDRGKYVNRMAGFYRRVERKIFPEMLFSE